MPEKTRLTKKQREVIDELFAGELDERAVLRKHKVSPRLYDRWQGDGVFVAALERRMAAAYRQSAALIARYAPVAAAKLVELTQSEKEETARKACLDIISMPQQLCPARPSEPVEPDSNEWADLSDEAAARILAVLAEHNRPKRQ